VFVHRNVGNLVPGNDLNALSVIEYAVTHLGVTDIIVTGHYDCGAVRAAASRQDLGLLENWLRLIRDVYRLHKDYLDLIAVRMVNGVRCRV
jgi:carbonic anhydrase